MITVIELEEKIEGMPLGEALMEVERALTAQGEHPDEDILLLKAQILFAISDADPADPEAASVVLEIIAPFLENRKVEPYYPNLLYMATVATIRTGNDAGAAPYARELYEATGSAEAAFFLAYIYAETDTETAKGLELIEEYLKDGDYVRGAPVKVDLLIAAQRLGEAEALLKFCEDAYPDYADRWLAKRAYFYHCAGNADEALRITDQMIDRAQDEDARYGLFHNACLILNRENPDEKSEKTVRYIKDYIRRYPSDPFSYYTLARLIEPENLDAAIKLYEQVYRLTPAYAPALLGKYLKRNGKGDPEKYFAVYETFLKDEEASHWREVRETVYGDFYPYDCGQSARLLEKDLSFDPDYECAYTLLGKIHEWGIGVPKDDKKALSYYELGYQYKSPCGCGNVFYAHALYYGIGTERDEQKAKELLLDVLHGRDNDPDRECLYAVMAFETEGDPRFDRQKALKMLEKNESDAGSAYLLYRYAPDKARKKEYLARLAATLKTADRLERDVLQKYIDNPELPFVLFIRN